MLSRLLETNTPRKAPRRPRYKLPYHGCLSLAYKQAESENQHLPAAHSILGCLDLHFPTPHVWVWISAPMGSRTTTAIAQNMSVPGHAFPVGHITSYQNQPLCATSRIYAVTIHFSVRHGRVRGEYAECHAPLHIMVKHINFSYVTKKLHLWGLNWCHISECPIPSCRSASRACSAHGHGLILEGQRPNGLFHIITAASRIYSGKEKAK